MPRFLTQLTGLVLLMLGSTAMVSVPIAGEYLAREGPEVLRFYVNHLGHPCWPSSLVASTLVAFALSAVSTFCGVLIVCSPVWGAHKSSEGG